MKNMKMMAAGMCLLTVVSCQTKQGTGSLIGGGAGAALGGIVGQIIGHNGKSTAIGAAIGGAVGALCRMALGEWVMTKVSSFPYGTVVVNLIGCLIIGLVLGLYMQKPDLSQLARFFLVVGGLGAFTTFSTFAFENVTTDDV